LEARFRISYLGHSLYILVYMIIPKNIALVHDWLTGMRGGEKVLEVLCEIFPEAELFTLVHRKGSLSPAIERMRIKTSFIQRLPFGKLRYQYYLPLYPAAIGMLNLKKFDLVISSSHAAAKAVRKAAGALHICYCHTPMRYIWDQYDEYFGPGRSSLATRLAARMSASSLRRWDVRTALGVDHFIANSQNVRERIGRIYKREAEIIYPPVECDRFQVAGKDEGYYLVVSALVPYKRIDIAVEAFKRLGRTLVVVGSGPEERRLKEGASGNIEFRGWLSDPELRKCYEGCRALVFPGEEDFGIVPLEAMASGKSVIAYGRGGALETVVEGRTGIFFNEQSAEGLEQAVRKLDTMNFDPDVLRMHAMRFDRRKFRIAIEDYVIKRWREHSS